MLDQFVMEGMGSTFSKDNVNMWARETAREYVSEKTPLNEKIASIADKNHLNSEQIQRVVEATNLAVDGYMKGSDFDVAKTAGVLAIIRKPSGCPLSSGLDDYVSPPSPVDSGEDMHELFGVKPQDVLPSVPRKRVVQIKIIKLGSAKKELLGMESTLNRKLVQAERDLVKTAKQSVMQDKETLEDLFSMTKEAGLTKLAKKYFPVIEHVLTNQGVLEKVAFQAEERYISKDIKKQGIPRIEIINGNHAVLKRFQTLKRIEDDLVHARRAIVVCDDKIKKLQEESERIS